MQGPPAVNSSTAKYLQARPSSCWYGQEPKRRWMEMVSLLKHLDGSARPLATYAQPWRPWRFWPYKSKVLSCWPYAVCVEDVLSCWNAGRVQLECRPCAVSMQAQCNSNASPVQLESRPCAARMHAPSIWNAGPVKLECRCAARMQAPCRADTVECMARAARMAGT